MKLSTRTRYGTRALLELALEKSDKPVFLKDIAEKQKISLAYLEHLVAPLISAGIIRSTKGPKGGITLARKPEDIRLSEITLLLEGSVAPVECIEHPESCDRSDVCVTREVWVKMNEAMSGVLESVTLRDLVARHIKKGSPEDGMYYI